jgi:hypothetical protein
MSAIGSYIVLRRNQVPGCVDRTLHIRPESTGKWLFKKTEVVGISEFERAWRAALVEEVSFDYSGYVLGNYLDAQLAVNQIQLANEQSEVSRALCKVFYGRLSFRSSCDPSRTCIRTAARVLSTRVRQRCPRYRRGTEGGTFVLSKRIEQHHSRDSCDFRYSLAEPTLPLNIPQTTRRSREK